MTFEANYYDKVITEFGYTRAQSSCREVGTSVVPALDTLDIANLYRSEHFDAQH